MKDLVTIQNDQPITTSRIVAEKFGKEHFNVVRDIRNLIKDFEEMESNRENFEDTPNVSGSYLHTRAKQSSLSNVFNESERFFPSRYGVYRQRGFEVEK